MGGYGCAPRAWRSWTPKTIPCAVHPFGALGGNGSGGCKPSPAGAGWRTESKHAQAWLLSLLAASGCSWQPQPPGAKVSTLRCGYFRSWLLLAAPGCCWQPQLPGAKVNTLGRGYLRFWLPLTLLWQARTHTSAWWMVGLGKHVCHAALSFNACRVLFIQSFSEFAWQCN